METSTIVFDMNGFGMNNMDYQSVKFLVSCFQTFYPESLGQVLVVDAPWIFNGCWVVIKPWLDPVVASKIKFIPSSALEDHIDKKYIPKCLLSAEDGQEEGYSYQYFPQTDKELAEMKTIRDKTEMHEKMQNGLKSSASDFIKATLTWAEAEEVDENFPACGEKREVAVKAMQEAYKSLVPFIR